MSQQKSNRGFATRALHAGYDPHAHGGSRAVPLYQTTAYLFKDTDHAARLFKLEEEGYIYTRINNPTIDVFEKRMADLESGVAAVAFASGMAAISASVLALLESGDEIVASSALYGGTYNLFNVTLPKLGIHTRFVDISDIKAVEGAITDKTTLIFTETIANPQINVADIEALADLAHRHNLPLFVDNTVATPYLCRPIEHGADVVIHSASKFIGGHGGSLGGVMVDGGRFDWSVHFPRMEPYERFAPAAFALSVRAETLRDYGGAMAPFNAMLFIQGLETLSLRMERHCRNAEKVAAYLARHPAVAYVNYPSVPGHRSEALAQKYLPHGAGSLLSFGLKGGFNSGRQLVESCTFIHHLANLGDTKTLILHPASTSHEQMSPEQRSAAGVPDDLIRMSIGIEDADDIIKDLERGLGRG